MDKKIDISDWLNACATGIGYTSDSSDVEVQAKKYYDSLDHLKFCVQQLLSEKKEV